MTHPMLFKLPFKPLIISSISGLTLGTALYCSPSTRQPIRCDAASPYPAAFSSSSAPRGAQTGDFAARYSSDEKRRITPRTVRQATLGSMTGVALGLTLRIFSRALTFSVGLGILLIQWLASKGFHVFPTRWLQKKIRGIRIGSILEENAVFKLTMANAMLIAAFGQLEADD